ncbi:MULTISPECIES: metal ABC transporter ATP-binding protein [unclassified Oceanispirochaeta]|uniref:metal ABC transporter ATP-binding protein n=1 Tax=unclassified Oceanispirochaeta TaxID=2635722 RepID=UPI000E08E6A8|nr:MULTISPECIES: ATP-binding cassette domain-containing protein [unclassified Oceanispirochaeta]MBF9014698.1 ATP-binding cassette domain-containing protein [Oceanispirochaeta sp. M2]NPD70954.1 ATP-binding cassette domain-containing protein [Oceanispirochaeta sp. M1]RDG33787.1 ATP-binding cassette domain-containing protein [Oceanispirochaeta sp. M1]
MNPVLEIRDLHIRRQNREVLKGAELCLGKGEAAVLSGSNGCGKTTLLRCIAGLLPSDQGAVTILGMELKSSEWKKNRHHLAYVSQELQSRDFPVTVEEMAATGLAGISMSASKRKTTIAKALEDTGCISLKDRYFFSLSGGERQRVALARCLCQGARILLLDEPLTYLDKEGRRSFSILLENIRRNYGITILLVTHTEDELSAVGWKRIHLEDGILEMIK